MVMSENYLFELALAAAATSGRGKVARQSSYVCFTEASSDADALHPCSFARNPSSDLNKLLHRLYLSSAAMSIASFVASKLVLMNAPKARNTPASDVAAADTALHSSTQLHPGL
jgi:hypothetical protein